MFMKIFFASFAVGIGILMQMDMGEYCTIAEQKAKIKSSRHKLYTAVSDLEGYSKWHPGLGKITARDPKSQNHVGKEYIEIANMPHGETHYSVVIAGHSPPMFFSFTINSILESVHEYTLDNTDPNYTTVTLKIIARRRSYFFHYIASQPLRFLYGNQVLQILYNLKMLFH